MFYVSWHEKNLSTKKTQEKKKAWIQEKKSD